MQIRTLPSDTDEYRYHLDEIQLGGTGFGGPTLRDILEFATGVGNDELIHDDVTRSQEFADICDRYRPDIQNGMYIDLSVSKARALFDACMSAWHYADQNNYGNDSEPDREARIFGRHGGFMLHALARPWAALSLTDDGDHGFERIS